MTPGPTEPNAEQMQQYLNIIVDDLLKLFSGMKIPHRVPKVSDLQLNNVVELISLQAALFASSSLPSSVITPPCASCAVLLIMDINLRRAPNASRTV